MLLLTAVVAVAPKTADVLLRGVLAPLPCWWPLLRWGLGGWWLLLLFRCCCCWATTKCGEEELTLPKPVVPSNVAERTKAGEAGSLRGGRPPLPLPLLASGAAKSMPVCGGGRDVGTAEEEE